MRLVSQRDYETIFDEANGLILPICYWELSLLMYVCCNVRMYMLYKVNASILCSPYSPSLTKMNDRTIANCLCMKQ